MTPLQEKRITSSLLCVLAKALLLNVYNLHDYQSVLPLLQTPLLMSLP